LSVPAVINLEMLNRRRSREQIGFTALLLMALVSTMLTIPIVRPKLAAVLKTS
jgi:hypothetical protein